MTEPNPLDIPAGGTVNPRCDQCKQRLAFFFADQRWKCVNTECPNDE